MKSLILGTSLMLGTSAQAATYSYDYQGQTLSGDRCSGSCDYAFAGSLWLDESLLPGGTLSGAQLNLTYTDWDDTGPVGNGSYTVTSSAGTFEGLFSGMNLPDFVRVDGDIYGAIFGIIYDSGTFDWTFNSNRQIVDWHSSGMYGGSNDFSIGSGGDVVADGSEAGPGTWTLTVTEDAPAPSAVPLPAGAFLLVGALGALGVSARKREARG